MMPIHLMASSMLVSYVDDIRDLDISLWEMCVCVVLVKISVLFVSDCVLLMCFSLFLCVVVCVMFTYCLDQGF